MSAADVKLWVSTPFKRPKAPVAIPNENGSVTEYFFLPCDPTNPNSEHVALVKNNAHLSRLLSIDGGKAYRIADYQGENGSGAEVRPLPETSTIVAPAAAAAPQISAAAADAAVQAAAAMPGPVEQPLEGTGPRPNEPQVPTRNQRDTEASELLAMPLKDFKAELPKRSMLVAAAALLLEENKSEADKRPTYLKALNERLKKA